jgi:hypothetical protein
MMPTPPVGVPFETARDTLAQFMQQSEALHGLGLPTERSVFQADTAESPTVRPFIVRSLGPAWVDGVSLWVYDDFGDYNRATKLAVEAAKVLRDNVVAIPTLGGWLTQIQIDGQGLGLGGDLADDGFQALVKPYNLLAAGRGV